MLKISLLNGEKMSTIQDMQTNVATWLEDNSDHEDYDMAKAMFESYNKTNKTNQLKAVYALTRTARQRIVLTQEQIEVRDTHVTALMSVFNALPELEVPRKKDFDNVQAKVEKAIKEQAKNQG
tara:strand:+ start:107 stop:475 length:369 start_codon:yes stop_codon:yes gene_type:complete